MINEINEFVGQNLRNHGDGDGDGSSSIKRPKFINFFINNRSDYSEQVTNMLNRIHVNFNNVKDETDTFVSQDLGDHGNGNSSSSTRHPKVISFSVNNRSSYLEELTTTMKIIPIDMDDIKVNDTVRIPFGYKMEYKLMEKMREAKKKYLSGILIPLL